MGEDCPVFDGMYEFCQLSAGGSIGNAPTYIVYVYNICIPSLRVYHIDPNSMVFKSHDPSLL